MFEQQSITEKIPITLMMIDKPDAVNSTASNILPSELSETSKRNFRCAVKMINDVKYPIEKRRAMMDPIMVQRMEMVVNRCLLLMRAVLGSIFLVDWDV